MRSWPPFSCEYMLLVYKISILIATIIKRCVGTEGEDNCTSPTLENVGELCHRVFNQIKTTGATSGAGTTYPSGAPEFTVAFQWSSCYSIFSLMFMFCRSLFSLLSFFFWPLLCLSCLDLRILITPLLSSNSSQICCDKIDIHVCTIRRRIIIFCVVFFCNRIANI